MVFKQNEKLVFIGDSITEDGRFEDSNGLGVGYVRLIHDYLHVQHPSLKLNIINKGISGDRITDLAKRFAEDVLDQTPDYVSLSIGINDVWKQLKDPMDQQVYPNEFEEVYRELLLKIKRKTDAHIIIMEPTVIGEDIHSKGNSILKEYIKVTKRLSHEFETTIIPLHSLFINHIQQNPENKLTIDGVHMNSLGQMLMAVKWMEEVRGTYINKPA